MIVPGRRSFTRTSLVSRAWTKQRVHCRVPWLAARERRLRNKGWRFWMPIFNLIPTGVSRQNNQPSFQRRFRYFERQNKRENSRYKLPRRCTEGEDRSHGLENKVDTPFDVRGSSRRVYFSRNFTQWPIASAKLFNALAREPDFAEPTLVWLAFQNFVTK